MMEDGADVPMTELSLWKPGVLWVWFSRRPESGAPHLMKDIMDCLVRKGGGFLQFLKLDGSCSRRLLSQSVMAWRGATFKLNVYSGFG